MTDKTITVPLKHYLILSVLGLRALVYYTEHCPARTPDQNEEFARLVRWEQWHTAAEERGLTR